MGIRLAYSSADSDSYSDYGFKGEVSILFDQEHVTTWCLLALQGPKLSASFV